MLYKVFIIHFCFSALFLGAILKKETREKGFLNFLIALLIPLAGPLFILILEANKWFIEKNEKPFYMLEGLEKQKFFIRDESDKETLFLPINDTLLIEDKALKREIIRNIIIKAPPESISIIKEALADKDEEIAHYAASALIGHRNRIDAEMNKLEKTKALYTNIDVLRAYQTALINYLNLGLLNSVEKEKTEKKLQLVLDKLYDLECFSKDDFLEKINMEINKKNYQKAEEFANLFFEKFPDTEEAFLALAKLYYLTGNYELLLQTIEKLKKSEILFSNSTLEIVRFWGESRL